MLRSDGVLNNTEHVCHINRQFSNQVEKILAKQRFASFVQLDHKTYSGKAIAFQIILLMLSTWERNVAGCFLLHLIMEHSLYPQQLDFYWECFHTVLMHAHSVATLVQMLQQAAFCYILSWSFYSILNSSIFMGLLPYCANAYSFCSIVSRCTG